MAIAKMPNLNRRFWVAMVTMAIVAALFGYYFLIHVKNRKADLTARHFRELAQMGKNILELRRYHVKTIDNNKTNAGINASITPDDAVRTKLQAQNMYFSTTRKPDLDSIYFPYSSATSRPAPTTSARPETIHQLAIAVDDFLKKIPRDPQDAFFVVRIKQLQDPVDTVYKVIFQTNLIGHIQIKRLDSLYTEDHGIRTIPVTSINISGVTHKIFTHIIHFDRNEEWILCKAMTSAQFESEARQIDPYIIVYTVLIGLFILLAMPVLKLIIMNEIERLRIINVWFSGFSIVVGTSVLIILIMAGAQHIGHQTVLSNRLEMISDTIQHNLLDELGIMQQQLKDLQKEQSLINQLDNEDSRLISVTKEQCTADLNGHQWNIGQYDRDFNQILLIKGNGDLSVAVISDTKSDTVEARPFSLSDREYFFKAQKEMLWHLKKDPSPGFALQSIRSWSDGMIEAGIGIPLKRPGKPNSVLAMAAPLPSVIHTLMPPGYGFAIIDETGLVWFHSESDRNMQENFLSETEPDAKLSAAIKGRMGMPMRGKYFNKPHQFYVQPIDNLPLYIVTFYDLEYKDTPLILTVTVTFALATLMFLIVGVQLFFQFTSVYRHSRLKIRRFYLNWMRPRRSTARIRSPENVLNIETYARSIILLMFFLLLHLCMGWSQPAAYRALCFLLAPAYIYLFQYLIFERDKMLIERDRKKRLRSNADIISSEFNSIESRERKRKLEWLVVFRHPFLYLSMFLIVLVNIALKPYVFGFEYAVGLQLLYMVIFFIIFQRWKFIENIKNRITASEKQNLTSTSNNKTPWTDKLLRNSVPLYFAVVMLWLVNTTALPIVYLYRTAHCTEYATWTKYLSWKAASDEYLRQRAIDPIHALFDDTDAGQMEKKGNYLNMLPGISQINEQDFLKHFNQNIKLPTDTSQRMNLDSIIGKKRLVGSPLTTAEFLSVPTFTRMIASAQAVLGTSALDNTWAWYSHANEDSVDLKFQPESGRYRYYTFARAQSDLMNNEYIPLMIICFLGLAWLVYRTTLFSIRNIFGLGIVLDYAFKRESKRKIIETDLQNGNNTNARYFIVGLPSSGKHQLLNQFIKGKKVLEIDFQSGALQKDDIKYYFDIYEIIVIKHFEHGVNDPALNERKLDLFSRISGLKDITVIALSTVQPTSIIDFYEYMIQKGDADKEEKQNSATYKQAIRKWKNALSRFVIYYQPLECTLSIPPGDQHYPIASEISYGNYLPKLSPQLRGFSAYSNTYEEYENVVLRVEELADTYYHSLWNSLSNEEKYLMFDLAKDRFVNLRNTKAIRILMQKGVIKAEDSLQIMNLSFNNFILSTVNRDEEIRMEQEQAQKGAWNTVYTVLVILFLGMIGFVAFAQQKLLHDFMILVGALSSALALLSRFGGLFGGSAKPKE